MTAKPSHPTHEGCHYVPGLLAVRPDQIREARAALLVMGPVRDTTKRWSGRFFATSSKGSPGSPVGLLEVPDPHEAASFLAHRSDPIQAAPIHGVGFEGHRGYMSGDGPKPAKEPVTAVRKVKLKGVIAVVDSGIVDSRARPAWMTGETVLHDRGDVESTKNGPSHGTFVTSVLRQVAPDHAVSIAAAPPDRKGLLTTSRTGTVDDPPTSELDVMAAIIRLVQRHEANPSEVKALNLSLGAGACSGGDGFLLTLSLAIDYWRAHFGRSAPIFAAAGNSLNPRPVYPAALDCVRGVAAADKKGTQTVWDKRTAANALPRWWVDDVAPGVKITGLSGTSSSDTVWWSGSSFSTAVATASSVSGRSFQVDDGITCWQTSPVDYKKVENLPFE